MTEDSSSDEYRDSLTQIKRLIYSKYNWSLHEIDETDFSNLLNFINFESTENKNTKVIEGQVYKRVESGKVPSWL